MQLLFHSFPSLNILLAAFGVVIKTTTVMMSDDLITITFLFSEKKTQEVTPSPYQQAIQTMVKKLEQKDRLKEKP